MTTHRERLLGQARADLVALPALVEELSRLVADRHHDVSQYRGKVIGSPAPLQIPVVHLVGGGQHKAAWYGEDPSQPRWALTWYDRNGDEKTAHTRLYPAEVGAWHAYDRLEPHQQDAATVKPWKADDLYKTHELLELWIWKLADVLPEFPDLTEHATPRSEADVLIEHWNTITDQPWAETLASQITARTAEIRQALGEPKEQKYLCPECQNPAYLVPGGILSCQEGHERVVRDLERQQRRRPAISTKDTCAEFGLTETQLWQWKHRRKITPTKDERGRLWWWPWDVFCLLNPDIAEAIRLRDEMAEDDQREAERAVP